MKGDKVGYSIDLRNAFKFTALKRPRKALSEIKAFVNKHARPKEIRISNEVNGFIFKHSKNIPRRIEAVLYREGSTVSVFLQGGKEMDAYIKMRAEEKKRKEPKKEKKEASKEEKAENGKQESGKVPEGEAAEDAEKKRLLEEKRIKEEAGKALEHKRG
ncbi:Uncharacterised protein [uncultured archaeon]|nr:Uncharacterised protein [uncultured archaeon]